MTSLQQTALGGGSFTAKTISYVLVAADAGTTVAMNAAGSTTITVNTSLFAAGDRVFIQNLGAGVCTITAGTATVATSGSLVLAQNQGGELNFTSASAAIFFQYATPASGDIEGVTAGTGISGGGTSGTVTVTNSMATAIDAKGDLIVGTGADAFSRLAVGTNTYTLVADSAEATGLKWAAAAGGGKVLQVVQATATTEVAITAATYQDAGLSASITPSSASSKVLVLVSQPFAYYKADSEATGALQLLRDSTQIYETTGVRIYADTLGAPKALQGSNIQGINFLDSPATTSAITYKMQAKRISASGCVIETQFTDYGPSTATMILLEIGA